MFFEYSGLNELNLITRQHVFNKLIYFKVDTTILNMHANCGYHLHIGSITCRYLYVKATFFKPFEPPISQMQS